jgi:hypothetical protein
VKSSNQLSWTYQETVCLGIQHVALQKVEITINIWKQSDPSEALITTHLH